MGLGDITGIFSRYFVVGFFLPAYISLISLWLTATSAFRPNALDGHSETTQVAVLGAVALVGGLALSGLSYYVTRVFEGYPLERLSGWPVAGRMYDGAIALQRRSFDHLLAIRDDKTKAQKERRSAAWSLDKFYPHERERLLPTRVGNAIRAFESHSNVRWGLDGVTIWPRVELLLSADERDLQVDAKINFYVFINAATGALIVGACLVIDKGLNAPTPTSYWPLYVIPFVLSYILYRAALGPATDWGDTVRASIDLHRLEIYEKLGVRAPTSFSDERALADRVNRALLYGHPLLSDDLWRAEIAPSEQQTADAAQPGLISCLRQSLSRGGRAL
jgi:hypothetical protein